MRIISLLPSATEIVCQLGLETALVGITHECDYPRSIAHLPRVTASKIDASAKSREIHRSINGLLKNALSIYDLNLDLLKTLGPDYLITQDLCQVCAVPFSQVEEACQQFLGAETKIISLRPRRLDDIWNEIDGVGKTLGAATAFGKFKDDVSRRIRFIRETLHSSGTGKKSVLTIEWMDPVILGGHWVPEMIEMAGGECLLATPGETSSKIAKDALAEVNPEVVLVNPCGFKLEQTAAELETLKNTVPWNGWRAYRDNNIFLVDGNTYFNRPGPRMIDSLEILAYCIHPDLFPEFAQKYRAGFIRLGPELQLAKS